MESIDRHESPNQTSLQPSGTGKSLSVICATFSWLRDFKHEKRSLVKEQLDELNKKLVDIEKENSVDWIEQHRRKTEIDEQRVGWVELNRKLERFDLRTEELKSRRQMYVKKQPFGTNKKRKTGNPIWNQFLFKQQQQLTITHAFKTDEPVGKAEQESESVADENLIDYESDEENEAEPLNEEEDNYVRPKVIYCSRTHSQLSQFISEIQKTSFKDKVRVLALGSRVNLCVNPEVNRSKNLSIINDKCMDLQRKGKQSCSFKKVTEIKNLRDELLATQMDIEDAFEAGKQLRCCSYYAGRYAIEEAEVLVVPYNILLHEKTRSSFNLKLDQSVVIVDEAHNLLDTISSTYSVEIRGGQLMDCLSQLTQYQLRYNSRLNARNMMHIKQLIAILNSLIKYIQRLEDGKVLTVVDLDLECGIENFNLFDIIDFCEKAQLPRKLFGFVLTKASQVSGDSGSTGGASAKTAAGALSFLERMKNQKKPPATAGKGKGKKAAKQVEKESSTNENKQLERPTSHLYQVLEFLKSLTNELEDGRVIVTIDKQSVRKSSLKFILLNPAKRFDDILQQARSVILIGGTMEPISQFTDTLFAANCGKHINEFACDHVIPDENLFVSALVNGPSKTKFDFSYQQRSNNKVLGELGNLLVQVCGAVRGGIVVFFVSYDFEEKIHQYFKSNRFIDQFEKLGKAVYREPRTAGDVNGILSKYSESVYNGVTSANSLKSGALLFSVVGGKMSEGINFNDDLGRCVVMVGLPYANIKSIELKQKMQYIEKQSAGDGKRAANEYYENLCMKAVNQSIGRAIRHQKDYASILLVDHRYASKESVRTALPSWIKKRYKAHDNFDDCMSSLKRFFQAKTQRLNKKSSSSHTDSD